LKDDGIIQVRPSNWAELLEQEEVSVDSPNVDKNGQYLEKKMESLILKMNMFFVCVVCVALGSVLMYGVIK
jgi:hypothetical protein